MTTRRVDLRLGALLAIVGLAAGCASPAKAQKPPAAAAPATTASTTTPRTVTAVATGQAKGVPDTLEVDLTVHTSGPSAANVMADDSTRTQGVIDLLGATGVSPKDVQTTGINLGPTFDSHGRINGYGADSSLKILFRDLRTAGIKLDALVGRAGDAVRIGSVSLGFGDDTALTSSARADGVRRAVAEARVMAQAAGATLGRVHTITEVVATSPYADSALRLQGSAASAGVPIAAGQQVLTVQVQAVFELA